MIRNKARQAFLISAFALVLLLALPGAAYAYIDPGTGAMLLQLLLGGIAGSLVIIKLYWFQLRQAIGRFFGGRDKTEKVDAE